MPRSILPFLLLVLLPSGPVVAQGRPSLVPGTTVRVVTLCVFIHHAVVTCPGLDEGRARERILRGEVVAMGGDTLRLRIPEHDEVLAIPLPFVARVTVRDGTRGNTLLGAGIGLIGGAVLGALVGSTVQFCIFMQCSPATGIGMLLGMPAGLLLGAIIGSSVRSEHWRSALPDDDRVSVALRLDTPGLAVRARF